MDHRAVIFTAFYNCEKHGKSCHVGLLLEKQDASAHHVLKDAAQ